MLKTVLLILFSIIFLSGCRQEKFTTMPAEWEKQDAVFLTYTFDPDDSLTSNAVSAVCNELIEIVARKMKVFVLIDDQWRKDSIMNIFSEKKYNIENIELVGVKDLFSMGVARDYGPLVVKDQDGNKKLLQFNWDYVGADMLNPDPEWTNWKNKTRDIYFKQISSLLKMDITQSELTIEGGEIELNGQGTALLVESFTKDRNPKVSSEKFDSLLSVALGVNTLVWLKKGLAEDPSSIESYLITDNIYGFGVGGHVDEFARFANSKTILLAHPDISETKSDAVKRINYERMKENFDILTNAKDQSGNSYEIIKVPIPDIIPQAFVIDTTKFQRLQIRSIMRKNPQLTHGDTIQFLPAVSYLNYIILNDLVVIPKYWEKGLPESTKRKDEEVKQLFRKLFPNKDIIQLNPLGLNYAGGGFHCWTQQVSYN